MDFEKIYPKCIRILKPDLWKDLTGLAGLEHNPDQFPNILEKHSRDARIPGFIPGLAQIELALHRIRSQSGPTQKEVDQLTVNPTFNILELKWKNLSAMFHSYPDGSEIDPEPGDEMLLIWRVPDTGEEYIEAASNEDLLVLKMTVENIPAETIADLAGVPVGAVDAAVDRAIQKGLLLTPESLIKRDPCFISNPNAVTGQPCKALNFTLQWHVTQACDLRCKHCYDRSARSELALDQGLRILDDLRSFCRTKHVHGHVTFSGGNPLLYPHFRELYRAASENGFSLAILGNPALKSQIQEIEQISPLSFFQVSLEGLKGHNDSIRGPGHFERTISFLEILKDLNIYSMVMLTLTKDNIDQVIPLAEYLRNRANHFTFNRLSQVGEGANLRIPTRDEYHAFLKDYIEAANSNPVMGLKDNLINILHYEQGIKTTGGCTGFGCGAAFNFLTLLPDGEVHACRKFPSLLGNIFEHSLYDIYDSETSRRYRTGSASCNSCPVKPSCGGCLASTYSHGLDIFNDRDPFCFIDD